MNFIVASLLFHSGPEVAYQLTAYLIEDCELCDVLKDDLAGLHDHNTILEKLI